MLIRAIFQHSSGGWWHSNLIEKHLISVLVPFLPLERKHIRKCIVNELNKLNRFCDPKTTNCGRFSPTEELVSRIADTMQYFPPNSPQFAVSGCKRIADMLDQLLMDDD